MSDTIDPTEQHEKARIDAIFESDRQKTQRWQEVWAKRLDAALDELVAEFDGDKEEYQDWSQEKNDRFSTILDKVAIANLRSMSPCDDPKVDLCVLIDAWKGLKAGGHGWREALTYELQAATFAHACGSLEFCGGELKKERKPRFKSAAALAEPQPHGSIIQTTNPDHQRSSNALHQP